MCLLQSFVSYSRLIMLVLALSLQWSPAFMSGMHASMKHCAQAYMYGNQIKSAFLSILQHLLFASHLLQALSNVTLSTVWRQHLPQTIGRVFARVGSALQDFCKAPFEAVNCVVHNNQGCTKQCMLASNLVCCKLCFCLSPTLEGMPLACSFRCHHCGLLACSLQHAERSI